jgi:hypothetical protein
MEVLISISLTMIAFVGIFATYTTSIAVQKELDDRAKILFMVQRTLEQALAVNYDNITLGTTVEIIEGEIDGLLTITNTIEGVTDSQIHQLWTRFQDPSATTQMKKITIQAQWGKEGTPTSQWEKMVLTSYRVERENTVDFSERASSQLPWY